MTPNRPDDERNDAEPQATERNDAALNDAELHDDFVLPDDIASLLAQDEAWAPVSDGLEASIISSVLAEVERFEPHAADQAAIDAPDAARPSVDNTAAANVVAFPSRWKAAALGAAAALVLVVGLLGMTRLGGSDADLELALAGTELAPRASAVAEITDTPEGTRIVIRVTDLPPAAPGTYYQAWLRKDAEVGVSAGTFHLRSGDGPIELWAGVSTDDYPLLTITLQQEAQTESSGQVVLKALIAQP